MSIFLFFFVLKKQKMISIKSLLLSSLTTMRGNLFKIKKENRVSFNANESIPKKTRERVITRFYFIFTNKINSIFATSTTKQNKANWFALKNEIDRKRERERKKERLKPNCLYVDVVILINQCREISDDGIYLPIVYWID